MGDMGMLVGGILSFYKIKRIMWSLRGEHGGGQSVLYYIHHRVGKTAVD